MSKSEVREILRRPEKMAEEINLLVPAVAKNLAFRADLAGLLVVAMAASYESSFKETLYDFSSRHHPNFGEYTQRRYEKLSSRVALSDLYSYCGHFDPDVHRKFGALIKSRKKLLFDRTGKDFADAYKRILDWRHEFAHTGRRNTTVEVAVLTHRLAMRVPLAFADAFA